MYISPDQANAIKLEIFKSIVGHPSGPSPVIAAVQANAAFEELYGAKPIPVSASGKSRKRTK